MKRIIIVGFFIALISVTFMFFIKKDYKNENLGNNISNKSMEEIKEYILDINSYEAEIKVVIKSNKNENIYLIKQEVKTNLHIQEILEPENIRGLKTIWRDNQLTIENTKLNLNKIYKEYNYINNNALFLTSFIEDYKNSNETKFEKKVGEIILETKVQNSDNKYIAYKKLYLNEKTGKPIKLEVQDITQNITVYILYNEIKINKLAKYDLDSIKS